METASASKSALGPQQETVGRRHVVDRLTIILFLLPAFALFVVFIVFPILQSLYYSFFSWKGFGPAVDVVGLDNFKRILGDRIFMKAVANGLVIVVLSVTIQLPLALALALLVGRDLPGRAFFRTVFFMPYVLSEVITGIMWLTFYNPQPSKGFINALITLIPGVKAQPWLGSTSTVLICIFVVLTWKYFGFYMTLFVAGLQNIPEEIEEAARIDGANRRQLLTNITLPLLGSTIRTCVYLSVLGSLQVFAVVWIMTQGGPVNASDTMATYMYRYGFVRFWFGYGCAVALVMLLISLGFSLTYQRVVFREEYLGST